MLTRRVSLFVARVNYVDGERQMLFLHCDVSKEEQVKACITRIEQEFGGLDVLVNK